MNIKSKIRLVLLILFGAITLFAFLGNHYLQQQAEISISLMQDNYRTLKYTREMTNGLNDIVSTLSLKDGSLTFRRTNLRKAFGKFERYLDLQEKNITETGESDVTNQLHDNFETFKELAWSLQNEKKMTPGVYIQILNIQELLKTVNDINEEAVLRKTDKAKRVSDRISFYTIVLIFVFFIFMVFSLLYFPDYIADPIRNLTENIREIAKKDYSRRIEVNYNDEFGVMADSFNIMAEKLEEYENMNVKHLLFEKQRLESIITRMREPIIGMDNNKNVIFYNKPFARLFGIEEQHLIGKSAIELVEEYPLLDSVLGDIISISQSNGKYQKNIEFESNGKMVFYNKEIINISTDQHNNSSTGMSGIVVILKNVTKLKERDIAKTKFMATLSHELKTPISAIDMSLHLLTNKKIGELSEEQLELTSTINKNTGRLLKIVNDILDLTKIETGNIQLNFEETYPTDAAEWATENLKSLIEEKQIDLEFVVDKNLPKIKMDTQKTTGIIINLLTNAIRYTQKKGKIILSVSSSEDYVIFSVKDFGIGLSSEEQKRIFGRYHRAKGDKTIGSGLGLAIAKEFVEAQGGSIGVESEQNKGSTFYFTIPK